MYPLDANRTPLTPVCNIRNCLQMLPNVSRRQNCLGLRTTVLFLSRRVPLSAPYVMSVIYVWNKSIFYICIILTYTTSPLWTIWELCVSIENNQPPSNYKNHLRNLPNTNSWTFILDILIQFWIVTWESEFFIRMPSYLCLKSSSRNKQICVFCDMKSKDLRKVILDKSIHSILIILNVFFFLWCAHRSVIDSFHIFVC